MSEMVEEDIKRLLVTKTKDSDDEYDIVISVRHPEKDSVVRNINVVGIGETRAPYSQILGDMLFAQHYILNAVNNGEEGLVRNDPDSE